MGDTKFTSRVLGCYVHAIEKAIRSLVADLVIYINTRRSTINLPCQMLCAEEVWCAIVSTEKSINIC